MDKLALLTETVERLYGLQNIQLFQRDHLLLKKRGVFEVTQTNGPRWMLRASRQEEDNDSLLSCAAVLQLLEYHHYQAPCVIEGIDGADVGMSQGWKMVMTTLIEGNPIEYTPEHLRALGATLGRLHMVPPHSWLHALHVGKETLHHLITEKIPPHLQEQCEMYRQTLLRMQQWENLPTVIVHGDCHPRNAIQTSSGEVVLIDWEKAGIGPAVLDIGALLLRCHPLWLRPNTPLIQAVIDGYCQYRPLTSFEFDALFDAICFKIALEGIWQIIDTAEREGNTEERGLRRLKVSYALAEEIALLARAHFEQYV